MDAPVKTRWIRPRWRKIAGDLLGNKLRTLLVVLSISVGVFAVGFVSVTFNILLPDMDADYREVNPHEAIISAESMSEELVDSLETVSGIAEIEGRSAISARALSGGRKFAITVTALPDLDETRIDRLRPDGDVPLLLGEREIFLERASRRAFAVESGDMLTLELSDGRIRRLRVAALVHDITASPYVFSNRMSAYTDAYTLEWLGGPQEFNQVYLTVSENKTDRTHVETVAQRVADKIERSGREVTSTYIFQPGRHYASDFITAIGVMLSVLGGLAVLLSAFLVVNTIISLLGQHVPQIGVMKLIGGSAFQIMSMYLLLVFGFGVLAFIIAAPLSLPLGYLTARAISSFFNFNLGPFRIPQDAILLQLGVALFIPALTALFPVLYGTRITITEAIGSRGLGNAAAGRSFVDAAVDRVQCLPRPLLISLRNIFRRKGRLLLALSTLTLGGAIFISVFNLWAVIDSMMDRTFGYFLSDVNLTLTRPYREEQLQPLLAGIEGVEGVEAWGTASAQLLSIDGKTATEISIVAPPSDSRLIRPVITAGRWLTPRDENALVIGNHLIKERPDLEPGDVVTLKIEGREGLWRIVGVYELAGMMAAPIVYANNDYLSALKHEAGRSRNFRLMTYRHSADFEKKVIAALDGLLAKQNIQVNQITSRTQIFGGMIASMDAIIYALLVMALLIAVVGGLGLTGIMSMNVMERTREIGVMRSVGASDQAILWMVIAEGLLIGALSWLFSILLAFPLTLALARIFGLALVNSPLEPAFTAIGYLVWLALIVTIAAAASAVPARSASRLTIREVLAYE